MRLFTAPDGRVNNIDRCAWLTEPFDVAWRRAVTAAGQPAAPRGGNVGPASLPSAAAGRQAVALTAAAVFGAYGGVARLPAAAAAAHWTITPVGAPQGGEF